MSQKESSCESIEKYTLQTVSGSELCDAQACILVRFIDSLPWIFKYRFSVGKLEELDLNRNHSVFEESKRNIEWIIISEIAFLISLAYLNKR